MIILIYIFCVINEDSTDILFIVYILKKKVSDSILQCNQHVLTSLAILQE